MIFVTGGTGLVGSYLLRALVNKGEKVHALRRSHSKFFLSKEIESSVEWAEGDLLDPASIEDGMQGCEKVYHAAAVVSYQPRDRKKIYQINVEGTTNVVNAALHLGAKKLVHVSSVAAISRRPGQQFISEETPWEDSRFNTHYAISKHLAEMEVWRGMAEGLPAVMVNPSLIMGAGDWMRSSIRIVHNVWKGLPAYTGGESGIVAAQDVAEIMIRLMESDITSERFIASAENWPVKKLVFTLAELLHVKPPRLKAKRWMSELIWRLETVKSIFTGVPPLITRETAHIAHNISHFDHSKIVAATGFQFTSIQQCLEETAEKFLRDLTEGKIK